MSSPGGLARTGGRRLVAALPSGALGVGAGLVLLGASSYVFLTLAARYVSPSKFAALSVLYTLVYTVGPGLFLPVEQELGRAIAHRREQQDGGGPVVRRAAALSLGFVVALVITAAAAWRPLTSRLFDGSNQLMAALLAAVVALWLAHVTRGALAGIGRFGAYGGQLGVEGVTRAGLCVVFALTTVHHADWYGWLLPAGLLLSVLATAHYTGELLAPGTAASWTELSQALVLLLAGSLLSQVLVNAAPVMAKLIAGANESAAAGQLLAGLVLTRVPLFLFAAVQAALLPTLAAALSRGEREAFLHGLRRLTLGLAGLGGLGVVGAAAIGPELMRLLFGAGYALSRPTLVALAAASGLFMLAAVFTQSLVALQRYAAATGAWAIGVAVFAATVAPQRSLPARVSDAFLAGAATASAASLMLLALAWRRHGSSTGAPEVLPIATVET